MKTNRELNFRVWIVPDLLNKHRHRFNRIKTQMMLYFIKLFNTTVNYTATNFPHKKRHSRVKVAVTMSCRRQVDVTCARRSDAIQQADAVDSSERL